MKRKARKMILLVGLQIMLSMSIPQIFAEELELEAVIVTAQKSEEDIQKTPLSITALSEIKIEDAGIENTIDLTRFSPNVYMKKSTSENVILIRGISSYESSIYSPTGFYVDDVNMPLHYMHNVDLYEVERVEVLKGPQGTLYGRNNEAGVVNVRTKQPEGPFQAEIFGDISRYSNRSNSDYKMGLSSSIPIVEDKLHLGLYYQDDRSDGYMTNVYNDDDAAGKRNHKNGRMNLRWLPKDNLDVSLILDAMDNDDMIGYYRFTTGTKKTERHEISHDNSEYSNEDGLGKTVRVEFTGNPFNVLSITGNRTYRNENLQDRDCFSDPNEDYGASKSIYENDHFSQEIRLFSDENDSGLKWLLGLYAFKENTTVSQENESSRFVRTTEIDISGNAFFAQASYPIVEKVRLTLGVRFDNQEQEGKQQYDSWNWTDNTPQSENYSKKLSSEEFLPKISLSYDYTDDIMFYSLVSQGYMSGGYNYSSARDIDSFTYLPEYTTNHEIGVKSSWFRNRLNVNLSYFYIEMKDKQVTEIVGETLSSRIANAAKAVSSGFEIEVSALPADGLEISAGLGVTDARYSEFDASEYSADYSSVEIKDYKDKKIPYIPENTFNISTQYRHQSGFIGRVDLFNTGSQYIDNANTTREDAYSLVNLRLGYEAEKYDVYLWGKNVFDQDYRTVKYLWGGDYLAQDGEPAKFGTTLAYRF